MRRQKHKGSLNVAQQLLNDELRLTGGGVYNGEQRDNDFLNFFTNGFVAERTELDSYVLVNIGANYQVTENVDLYLRVENLFDEDYEEVIGFATPGSSVYGCVRIRLELTPRRDNMQPWVASAPSY